MSFKMAAASKPDADQVRRLSHPLIAILILVTRCLEKGHEAGQLSNSNLHILRHGACWPAHGAELNAKHGRGYGCYKICYIKCVIALLSIYTKSKSPVWGSYSLIGWIPQPNKLDESQGFDSFNPSENVSDAHSMV